MTIYNHLYKSANIGLSVSFNGILSTIYDAGELLILKELMHLTNQWLRGGLMIINVLLPSIVYTNKISTISTKLASKLVSDAINSLLLGI